MQESAGPEHMPPITRCERMKATTTMIAIGLPLLFVFGCATPESDWAHASAANTSKAYHQFINEHPQSPYASEAKDRLASIAWNDAQAANTYLAYHTFLRQYPKSIHAPQARQKTESIAQAAWDAIQATPDDVNAYQNFLKKYPGSEHYMAARLKIEAITYSAWKEARDLNTVPALSQFLARFPSSQYSKRAQQSIDALEGRRAGVVVDFPRSIEPTPRSFSTPQWDLTITFRETGGKVGYTVTQGKEYWRSNSDGRRGWQSKYASGGTVRVKPGGETVFRNWWRSSTHNLCNSTYESTWSGKDDLGNPITIVVQVQSTHKDCPKAPTTQP